MTREDRLIEKGRKLRGFLEAESANVRSALDNLKSAVRDRVAVRTGNAEPFGLRNNQNLLVRAGTVNVQVVRFQSADFADIRNATASEVAAVLNRDLERATAEASSGTVLLKTNEELLRVEGGTANAALNFPTDERKADPDAIGRAVSAVRRAERGLRNAAGRVHIDVPAPGGGSGGGAGLRGRPPR